MNCVPVIWTMVTAMVGAATEPAERPNIVFCLTDDQGWGDVGYNGNPVLKTPNLDDMARSGIRFDRFYAAHCVCSPTRASCMTGRHPNRYRCFSWGYDLPLRETTVAEAVKMAGYATGHFGKWHLGGIPSGQGRIGLGVPESVDPRPRHPGNQGFDEWFSARNWFDLDPDGLYHNGQPVGKLQGDTSDIVMEAAVKFIRKQVAAKQPFLAAIWFPSPHGPWKALPEDKAPYAAEGGKADFYGELAGVDRAMGRLRAELRTLGIHRNTMLWFCSDNGAQGGSTGGLSGQKGNLREGGIRVPGLLEWPARIARPLRTDIPACTSDFYPTLLDLLKIAVPDQVTPIDGISLLPLIDGQMSSRPKPIAFEIRDLKTGEPRSAALIDNQYKLLLASEAKVSGKKDRHSRGPSGALFDLATDPKEEHDLSAERPEIALRMKQYLNQWEASVDKSISEYPAP